MQEYQSFDYDSLVDLVANETAKLSQLLSERRFDNEYHQCKENILAICEEIELRSNSTKYSYDFIFSEE
jgi:hypothetical protein